jgi:Protein of unknown function (DUF4235)
MSKKKDGSGGHLAVTLAATGGAFVLRKVAGVAWTKVTGKEPPTDLADPRVTLPEALIWAALISVIVETVRFGIMRPARRQAASVAAGDAESD